MIGSALPLTEATPSQRAVMEYVAACHRANDRGLVWWMGGVRSGKSYGASMALMEHIRHRQGKTYMVLAYTAIQALQVFGGSLETIAEAMDIETKLNRSPSNPKLIIPENQCEVLFRGADKTGRDRAIQGLTLDGLVVDETPNLHRQTVHQAEARVSGHAGLRIYTSNKTSIYHWTTKYYMDRIKSGSIPGLVVDSNVAENLHVDKDYREERANEYQGEVLRRFMDNEFTLDNPPIYKPRYEKKKETGPMWISVFGHHSGWEIVWGTLKDHLVVRGSVSLEPEEDLVPILKSITNDSATVLIDVDHRLIAKRIRKEPAFTVRGYKPSYSQIKCEVLHSAIREGMVYVEPDSGLAEAIETYHKPGHYDYPVIVCVEATAHLLRSHVS